MVQFIDLEPGYGTKLQNQLAIQGGQALANTLGSQLGYQQKRSRLQEALSGLKGMDTSNMNIPDLVAAYSGALANTPGGPETLSKILPYLIQAKQAEGSQKVDYLPKGSITAGNNQNFTPNVARESRDQRNQFIQENQIPQRQKLPGFGGPQYENQFYPSNLPGNEQPGNLPQPETAGTKRKVLSPEEIIAEGKRIAEEQTRLTGQPTSVLEGIKTAVQLNDLNKDYNASVEADIAQRVESQRQYGDIAVQKLEKLLPQATDEQKSFFKRKGEEAAGQFKSEGDIERYLSAEARKFKNTLSNIKNSIPAQRLSQKFVRNILGDSRDAKKTRDDINLKLQPLLKEGLYDTSRNLLSELGYHPEEREAIITDLGEYAKKSLASIPSLKGPLKIGPGGTLEQPLTPQQFDTFQDSLNDIMKNDPNTNLILLRKAYEDKGVDWRTFKDALNDLVDSGEVQLNDDQFNHLDILDNPPLNRLEKILHGLQLIGR